MIKQVNLDLIIDNWKKRNLIKKITSISNLKEIILEKKGVYCGIDPTYDSLHLGHLIPLSLLKELSLLGCPVFAVIGGATAQIGDPSFRSTQRVRLDTLQIQKNIIQIKKQIKELLPSVKILDNLNWYKNFSILDFLNKISSFFTVKKMLQKESFAEAFEKDVLFHSEFSYILMQSYDFYYLWKNYNCYLQVGGSDQFPNIVFGINLIRKLSNEKIKVCGITTNLLLDQKGQKISKSLHHDNIWLDENKNSFYKIYQFFYNLDDNLIKFWINLFCCDAQISNLSQTDLKNRKLQKLLFFYLIEWIFGTKIKNQVQECLFIFQQKLFTTSNLQLINKLNFIDRFSFTRVFLNKINVVDLLLETKVTNSKSLAKKLILQKGIQINNQKVETNILVTSFLLTEQKIFLLKRGKREVILIKII